MPTSTLQNPVAAVAARAVPGSSASGRRGSVAGPLASHGRGSAARAPGRLRLGLLDRDSGFRIVLARRIRDLAWEHVVFETSVMPEKLLAMKLDAVVIDVGLLGTRSWAWLEQLCDASEGPAIVVCTKASTPAERVRALALGADDWLSKPCHPEELIARVEAVVRQRHRFTPLPEPVVLGEVEIRRAEYQAFVGEVNLRLTRRELQVIDVLSSEPGKRLARELIYERVWGWQMPRDDRSVDVIVHKLRRKLAIASPGWRYIHTHPAVGYSFSPDPCDGGSHEPPALAAGSTEDER